MRIDREQANATHRAHNTTHADTTQHTGEAGAPGLPPCCQPPALVAARKGPPFTEEREQARSAAWQGRERARNGDWPAAPYLRRDGCDEHEQPRRAQGSRDGGHADALEKNAGFSSLRHNCRCQSVQNSTRERVARLALPRLGYSCGGRDY